MVKLDLSSRNLTEIPPIPDDITQLDLGGNQITELKPGVFPVELQVLYLGYNKIVEIKEGVFPTGLQILELDNNKIVELPIHLLNLRSLISFNYTGNPIENISLPVQRWLDRLNHRITQNKIGRAHV